MERIYPITEKVCSAYVGKPVCAVGQDGTRYYGIIEEVRDGNLILNGYADGPATAAIQTFSHKRRKRKKNSSKAGTSAFAPGFGYRRFVLPLAALALLFAIPFFGGPFI